MRVNGGGRPHGFHHHQRTEYILLSVHVVVCSTYFLLLSFVGNTVLVHVILNYRYTLFLLVLPPRALPRFPLSPILMILDVSKKKVLHIWSPAGSRKQLCSKKVLGLKSGERDENNRWDFFFLKKIVLKEQKIFESKTEHSFKAPVPFP